MSIAEFIWALVVALALGTYAGILLWSPWAKRWSRRPPPAFLRPALEFWGLPLDASGNERFVRVQAVLLLCFAIVFALVDIGFRLAGPK